MRIKFSVILLIISIDLFAQIDSNLIDFSKLSSFDSVHVVDERGELQCAYVYANSNLKNERYYSQGVLREYTNYMIYNEQKITITQSSAFTSGYKSKSVRVWDDNYYVEVTNFQNNKITQKLGYEFNGMDSTLQERIELGYNSDGILLEEKILDLSKGYKDIFKSNSSEFGNGYEKTDLLVKVKRYKYDLRKIIIDYLINEKLTGQEIFEFNNQGKLISLVIMDNSNNKLGETNYKYNSKGQATQRYWAWYKGQNEWGNTVDFIGPTKQKVSYNSYGFPERITTNYWKQKSKTWYLKYY